MKTSTMYRWNPVGWMGEAVQTAQCAATFRAHPAICTVLHEWLHECISFEASADNRQHLWRWNVPEAHYLREVRFADPLTSPCMRLNGRCS